MRSAKDFDLRELLKQHVPPVTDLEHDLWPRMAARLEPRNLPVRKAQITFTSTRRGSTWRSTPRFALATLLILAAAIFLQTHSTKCIFPSRVPLKSFPEKMGDWEGTDIPLGKDVLQILGPGDFLLRDYRNIETPQPEVNLFIAYFASQRAGDTIHSPQNCLPGAGWAPIDKKRMTLDLPGHTPFPINRYLIAKGDSRQLVFYWYWAHDRGVASEYWAKYYLIADSIRMNRSDGGLVRIMTPMLAGETADAAQQRLLPFTTGVLPLLNNYIPR